MLRVVVVDKKWKTAKEQQQQQKQTAKKQGLLLAFERSNENQLKLIDSKAKLKGEAFGAAVDVVVVVVAVIDCLYVSCCCCCLCCYKLNEQCAIIRKCNRNLFLYLSLSLARSHTHTQSELGYKLKVGRAEKKESHWGRGEGERRSEEPGR